MKSNIYGFKEFDKEDLFYSESNTHAELLLEGLINYYNDFYKTAKENGYEFQCTDLKELLKLIDTLKTAQKQLPNIYEG